MEKPYSYILTKLLHIRLAHAELLADFNNCET